jgi:hypothetical protein
MAYLAELPDRLNLGAQRINNFGRWWRRHRSRWDVQLSYARNLFLVNCIWRSGKVERVINIVQKTFDLTMAKSFTSRYTRHLHFRLEDTLLKRASLLLAMRRHFETNGNLFEQRTYCISTYKDAVTTYLAEVGIKLTFKLHHDVVNTPLA